jgi:hypothetical protein
MLSLKGLDTKIESVVKKTILDYAQRIYGEAMSAAGSEIAATYSFEVLENGYRAYMYTDNEMAAYIEFHTGDMAKAYLSGKPKEMQDDAIQFFKTGRGTLHGNPYLFPAFYRYRDKIAPAIDKGIQDLFNKL